MSEADLEHDNGQLADSRWAMLAVQLVHPLDVQILEAFAWIDQALSERDLVELFEGKISAPSIHARLRRLSKLKAIEVSGTPVGRDRLDTPYCLAELPKRGF